MVGFRYYVVECARTLGLTGWVRNCEDGRSVEVAAEGPEEDLQRLERALRVGPSAARVGSLDITWSDATEGYRSFEAHP
jgi:acylphosphatase